MPTYLLPLALVAFKVGCHVESSIRRLKTSLTIKRLPNLVAFVATDKVPYQVSKIYFDKDSFSISINTFVLVMMGNSLDQFEDLTLKKDRPKVKGIQCGLDIEVTDT